jgi:uncharacterized protein (DUF1810 family)
MDCTALVNTVPNRSIGDISDIPTISTSIPASTLFARIAEQTRLDAPVFREALAKYFSDRLDHATLRQLERPE